MRLGFQDTILFYFFNVAENHALKEYNLENIFKSDQVLMIFGDKSFLFSTEQIKIYMYIRIHICGDDFVFSVI